MGDFDQHKHCREEEEEKEEEEGEGEGEVPPPRALSFCEWCSVLQILLSFWTCISASGPNERKVSLLSLILVNMQLPMATASGDYNYSPHDYSYDDGRAFGAGGGSKMVGGGRDGRSSLALSPAAGRGTFGDSTTISRTRLTDGGVFLLGAAADPKGGPDGAAGGVGAMGVSATAVAASEKDGEGSAEEREERQGRAVASSSAVVALRANSGGERNGA